MARSTRPGGRGRRWGRTERARVRVVSTSPPPSRTALATEQARRKGPRDPPFTAANRPSGGARTLGDGETTVELACAPLEDSDPPEKPAHEGGLAQSVVDVPPLATIDD